MPVIEYWERNAKLYPDEVALEELNPEVNDNRRTTWKEYELVESDRLTEVSIILFGPDFIGRIEVNAERMNKGRLLIFVGDNCPVLQRAIMSWWLIAPVRLLKWHFPRMILALSIFLPELPVFPKRYYINI